MNIKNLATLIVLSSVVIIAHAFPSLTPHDNDATTIEWESDGSQNGSTAHNHHSTDDFNGWDNLNEPFSAFQCWDNLIRRLDTANNFDNGHCFVDETNQNNMVSYRFMGTNWNAQAQQRIREVFEVYNDVVGVGGNVTGLEYIEITAGTPEIQIFWENQAGENNGGFYRPNDSTLHFDNSMNWFFGRDPMEGQPGGIQNNQWHFFTVMLHEVGHATGFFHQLDAADVMSPPVGQPPNVFGHRYFMGLDGDTLDGVRSLYSQPVASLISFSCHVTSEAAWNDYITQATVANLITPPNTTVTYSWSWGDGSSSTSIPPTTHGYVNSSPWDMYYNVNLTVSAGGESQTEFCGQVYVGGQG